MADEMILINRAPVLALWATVVAERLGFSRDEALSLGKAVTGLNAQTKGRHLGIYTKREKGREKREEQEKRDAVELMGREIPVVRTAAGIRAVNKDKPVSPEGTQTYLECKFGECLPMVRAAMEELARSMKPDVLAARAFALYAQFRPGIPDGVKGWGAKGKLDCLVIRSLCSTRK